MSLFNSQTIFSLLITLLIGVALYYYIKYKYRVLELTQREQAKVLQGVIMSMNSNNQNIMSMLQNKSQEEVISEAVNHDINRFNQVNSTSELIDVSDDSDSDSDDSSESGSDDSSESSDSGSDASSEGGDHDHDHEVTDNNTRKILFTGSNDSHLVEHLDGPDVKVIELTHPLYPKNNSEEYNNKDDGDDDDADDDADEDDDDDEDSDSESLPSDLDGPHEPNREDEKHEIREIKENVVISEMNNQNTQHTQIDLETDNISEVISVDNSLDNLSVKTVFKTKENNKDSETHSDYNSMNVQSLRQLLKNKLSTEGTSMSESSINKLTKKDLIKNLS
jgi:hypothetical protein